MRHCYIRSNWDLNKDAWGPGFPATVLYGDLESRQLKLLEHGRRHLVEDGHLNLTMLVFSQKGPEEDALSVLITPVHSGEDAAESQAWLEQLVKDNEAAWAMTIVAIRFTDVPGEGKPERAVMAAGRDSEEHLMALQYYEESGAKLTFFEPEVFPTANSLLSGCTFQ